MGFAGSALNMIKSLQMNRDQLHLRRKKNRELYNKLLDKDASIIDPEITVEEQERIIAETKQYKIDSKKRTNHLMLIGFAVIIVTVLIVYLILKIWVL